MEFRPADRAADSFQQSVTAEQSLAMCRRAFGEQARPVSVTEFGYGSYNSSYLVDLGTGRPVILRVAPEPSRQGRLHRELMRSEHASQPYLAPIAALLPRTLAVDFTREIAGRDYLFQTLLDGVPAPDGLATYPRPEWAPFFRQLGTIAGRIHQVRGDSFGRMTGPRFARWSEAYVSFLGDAAADLDAAGVDAADLREVAAIAARDAAILDEITQPRLLHGDLWTANVLIAEGTAEPVITGVCDCDRTCWGDPAADWSSYRAGQRPGTERDAYWDSYGRLPDPPAAARRALFYEVLHLAELRIEEQRLGRHEAVAASYPELRELIGRLSSPVPS